MTFEIRQLATDLEVDQAGTIAAQGFGGDGVTPNLARMREMTKPEWYLGTFEGTEMTSMMCTIPSAMRINGAAMEIGLVAPVATSPLHRRKGHAGAMLRQSLEDMRERGQSLSALYTPHPALYRRYGWEVAADYRRYEFKPKDCELTAAPAQRGRLTFVTTDGWARLDAIFRRYAERRNGPMDRDENWWRFGVIDTWMGPANIAVWSTNEGVDEGYVIYQDPSPPSRDVGKVTALEFVAVSSDAHLNLLSFLVQHDIREEIRINAASDDTLPLLFSDAERLEIRMRMGPMLRIVDVETALRRRPVADPELQTELSLEVRDGSAPWNTGTWRIRVESGVTSVEKASMAGEISLDVRVLAPMFNGYVAPSSAAAAGLATVSNEDTLARADAFFQTSHRPYFPDRF
jgi:predicted acetyltransferase